MLGGIDPGDKVARIWRVELRLCRDEIKKVQRLRSFADLEVGFCRALCSLMQRVRYVAAGEMDMNVTRRRSDPLWAIARQHIESADLLGGAGDLPPSRLLEISRDMKIACHTKLITGNAASLAAAMSLDENTIKHCLSDIVGSAINVAVPTDSFQRSFSRAQMRQQVVHNEL